MGRDDHAVDKDVGRDADIAGFGLNIMPPTVQHDSGGLAGQFYS